MDAGTADRVTIGRLAGAALAALCVIALAGCSSYVDRSLLIKQALVEKDYDKALENVEEINQSSSGLLYYYEKGLVLHYNNKYAESNAAFEQAELLFEDLYTKSVTRELAALAVKEDIAKYRGEPYEAVLVNYYKILNYLHLNDIDGALVECRRVNQKLQMIIDAGEETYRNDPFVQYLTAMVYDAAGESQDAAVSYRVAAASFHELSSGLGVTPPSELFCDAANNAARVGDAAARDTFLVEVDGVCDPPAPGSGTVNLFLESGYVTYKVEESAVVPIYTDDNDDDSEHFAATLSERRGKPYRNDIKIDYLLKFALPVLAEDPPVFEHATVRARPAGGSEDSEFETHTVVVENIGGYARREFEAHQGKVVVRAIVRALTKYAAKKTADDGDAALGVLVNVFNVATETADTRSWSTLPQRIHMARLHLPAGTWNLEVTLFDTRGAKVDQFAIDDVVVREGAADFVNYRIY